MTAEDRPPPWTEAEVNAWISANAWNGASEETNIKNGLSKWLEVVTQHFSVSAATHIRSDVYQRVNQETIRLEAEGLSSLTALRQAMTTLGYPLQAVREYENVYLTGQEVARIVKPPRLTLLSVLVMIFYTLFLWFGLPEVPASVPNSLILASWLGFLPDSLYDFWGKVFGTSRQTKLLLSMYIKIFLCVSSFVFSYLIIRPVWTRMDELWRDTFFLIGIFVAVTLFILCRRTTRLVGRLNKGLI